MAGGLALAGMLPVVHSFSCFLSTRPNEQIYNNATEHTKIVYVGGLSGVLPAGPGHSHQSVREISALGGVPNLVMVAPVMRRRRSARCSTGASTRTTARHSCAWSRCRRRSTSSCLPATGRSPAAAYALTDGRRCPSDRLRADDAGSGGCHSAQPALPRESALRSSTCPGSTASMRPGSTRRSERRRLLVTLDDHYIEGGQGEKVMSALASTGRAVKTLKLGLTSVPPSGQPGEVLAAIGLDAAGISRSIRNAIYSK